MDTRRVADGIASAFLDPVDTSYKHRTMPRNGRARIFRARTRRMYPIPEARIAKVRGVHYGRAKQWKDNTPKSAATSCIVKYACPILSMTRHEVNGTKRVVSADFR